MCRKRFLDTDSAAVPHVPDVRFSKCSINQSQTTGKNNSSIQTGHKQRARVRVHTWAMHDWTCTVRRTKTKVFKIESQRQESQTMNHLKSRTKPRSTRPQPESPVLVNVENREPCTSKSRKHNDQTRNPTPDPNRQCRPITETRNHAMNRQKIQATNRQKKTRRTLHLANSKYPHRHQGTCETRASGVCLRRGPRQRATSTAVCQFRSVTWRNRSDAGMRPISPMDGAVLG